nr:hypothetical protein [Halomonas elongata]
MNRDKLSERGFSYFVPQPWPLRIRPRKDGFDHEVNVEGFKKIQDLPAKNVIISHENYSWLYKESQIKGIRDALKSVSDEVKIVVYIRRQDSLAVSQKQEGTKWIDCSLAYGHELSPLPKKLTKEAERYLNFYDKLNSWAKFFGEENIIVRAFDPNKLVGGDAIKDFCSTVGLHIDEGEGFRSIGKVNQSISRKKQIFLHKTRPFFPERTPAKDLLTRSVVNIPLEDEDKFLPTRREALAFFDKFKKQNKLLEEKYGDSESLFSEDFSMYPESELKSRDMDDEEFLSIWYKVMESISEKIKDMSQSEIELSKRLALKIEKKNPQAALELMLHAKRNGGKKTPFIDKKIKQYRKN